MTISKNNEDFDKQTKDIDNNKDYNNNYVKVYLLFIYRQDITSDMS